MNLPATINSQTVSSTRHPCDSLDAIRILPEPPKIDIPRVSRSFQKMSPELWEMVMEYLPSLTGRHAAEVFNFPLTERHQRHSNIWSKIFKDSETWTSIVTRQCLNLVLIGDDLHSLDRDPMRQAYLALLTGDETRDIRYDKEEFLASLRPHDQNEINEIVFQESNITLNIDDVLWVPEIILSTPEKLFSHRHTGLRSASLYWRDNQYTVRTIGPDDIVGIGERASTLQDVSLICGVILTPPKEMVLRQRHQQFFEHPNCQGIPLFPISCRSDIYKILGWEFRTVQGC
jgi:hypothetical protein